MRPDIPLSVQDTSHDLTVEALVQLFELRLANNAIFRLSPRGEVTWRGQVYEEVPITMVGFEQNSDGKLARPKMSLVNPDGMFTAAVHEGSLDGALVTRYRVLKTDLDADNDFSIRETLRVSRILTLQKSLIVCELRDVLDGHFFQIPARKYQPPEFPFVRLG